MSTLQSLFLSQAYLDCWNDYNRSLKLKNFPTWDYVILTASNKTQADEFYKQIDVRRDDLPSNTKFVVIPDKDDKRVGSGGATLSVLKYLHEKEGTFDGLRVLVIHSGGDSKRVPQYSALGKLFSPVPHTLPNGHSSTLFDEFMICMSSVPSRIQEGMVLLSGDVLLLFNPLQIDFNAQDACAVSFKESKETGKNHGVYLSDENGYVSQCLQKKPVEELEKLGAVNEKGYVDIDTGALIFSTRLMNSLYSLIDTEQKYESIVNDVVRLSLYVDFLYPLGTDSSLDQFLKEKPEGSFCAELEEVRKNVWDVLSDYKLKLLRLAPSKFIHFGTTKEILSLMNGGVNEYKNLGWSNQIGSSIRENTACYNSIVSGEVGKDSYIEVSYIHENASVGEGSVVSFIEIEDKRIPSHVVVHGLKEKNHKFVVRIFGVNDNPKENKLFGIDLDEIEKKYDISLFDNDNHSLWLANIYPEKDTMDEAIDTALNLYDVICSTGNVEKWRNSTRVSLSSGFNHSDSDAIIAWSKRMQDLVFMENILKAIHDKEPASKLNKIKELTAIQKEWLEEKIQEASFSEKMRLYYYFGTLLDDENLVQKCFDTIQSEVLNSTIQNLTYNESARIIKDKQVVQLPLRVNFGGGWSDTPPYCNENGGTVLNAAILLNNELPVEVTLEKINDYKIIFDSRDMDVHGEFSEIEELQKTGDPYDPFALQKACLLACGIIPKEGHELKEILERLGGGFVMHSEVTNVPKGSGLGTSSILSAACVKCVFEFMGISYTEEDLYSHVLAMEQIMSTGGGWQDQVGGLTNGLKYITSRPGINQEIKVEHVKLSEETKKELDDRFCLIYTGQRRLARNLLRDVIGRYVGNEPDSLYALNEIQKVATLMRFELERGNVDEFAKLLHLHWDLSKKVDEGSSNTLIEQIFRSIDDLIDGELVCGAGGGGFLQVILKKGVSKKEVSKRLQEVFMDSNVDVADSRLLWEDEVC